MFIEGFGFAGDGGSSGNGEGAFGDELADLPPASAPADGEDR